MSEYVYGKLSTAKAQIPAAIDFKVTIVLFKISGIFSSFITKNTNKALLAKICISLKPKIQNYKTQGTYFVIYWQYTPLFFKQGKIQSKLINSVKQKKKYKLITYYRKVNIIR